MSDVSVDFPAKTNDTGTGRDGTVVDEAWVDTVITAINNQVLSAANPTVTPEDIIDEVVSARGNMGSLDARLDVALEENGSLKAQPMYATVTQLLGGIGGVNLVMNDDDLLWPDGDAAVPDGYVIAGAGATVARCGTGLGDTARKVGDFCAKFSKVGNDCTLTRPVLSAAAFARADFLKGLYAAGGAWVKCSVANAVRVAVADGAGTSYSSYHNGDGNWQWLPVTRQINAGATILSIALAHDGSNAAAYWSGRTLFIVDGNLLLPRYVPCPVTYGGTIHLAVSGVIAAANNLGRFQPARPGLVKDVQITLKTAPAANTIGVDVKTNNTIPAANAYPGMASMFTGTKPTVAVTNFQGGYAPDGTYARRCLAGPNRGATITALSQHLTIDTVLGGAEVTAADLGVEIRVMQYTSPLERFQTY
jgi:hypothetical protein